MDKIKSFLIIGNNSSEKSWNFPTNFSLKKTTDIFKILSLDKVQRKLKQCLVMGSAATSLIGVAPWAAAGFSHNCLKQTKALGLTVVTETWSLLKKDKRAVPSDGLDVIFCCGQHLVWPFQSASTLGALPNSDLALARVAWDRPSAQGTHWDEPSTTCNLLLCQTTVITPVRGNECLHSTVRRRTTK